VVSRSGLGMVILRVLLGDARRRLQACLAVAGARGAVAGGTGRKTEEVELVEAGGEIVGAGA